MKISYSNMPNGVGRINFLLRLAYNNLRTWYLFSFIYPWVKYDGFIRVMKNTSFARMDIQMGHHVQFGEYCNIASNVKFGNYILMAGRVCFVGRNDHQFNIPGQYIWNGDRGNDGITIIEDDVWIGHNSTILAGVKIEKGAIIAAGSVVTKDIPSCEIWGGIPARKIADRFTTDTEKKFHLNFLKNTI